MNIEQLIASGCYVVAGFIDIYDGTHKRLGQLTTGGDVVLTAEGEAYVQKLLAAIAPAEAPAEPKARKRKVAEPAPVVEAPVEETGDEDPLAALAALTT